MWLNSDHVFACVIFSVVFSREFWLIIVSLVMLGPGIMCISDTPALSVSIQEPGECVCLMCACVDGGGGAGGGGRCVCECV